MLLALKCRNPKFYNGRVIPCRVCPHCLRRRYLEWSLRGRHELIHHKERAVFFTLTYSDDYLPRHPGTVATSSRDMCGTLDPDHARRFYDRLRKYLQRNNLCAHPKVIYCGEYGPTTQRPHYHFLLFGVTHHDITKSLLNKLWPYGHNDISKRLVTDRAIMYTVGYIRKKMVGVKAKAYYDLNHRYPPFQRQSQGIGGQYALSHLNDWIHTLDFAYNGYRLPAPRYYQQLVFALEGIKLKFLQTTISPDGYRKDYYYYKVFKSPAGKLTDTILNVQYRNLRKSHHDILDWQQHNNIDFDFSDFFAQQEEQFLRNIYKSYKNYIHYQDFKLIDDFVLVGNIRDRSKLTHNDDVNHFAAYFGDDIWHYCQSVSYAHNYDIEHGIYGQRNKIDIDIPPPDV